MTTSTNERRTHVAIIDLGVNNLASISRRAADAGATQVDILREPEQLDRFTHIVLPGVGAFATAMRIMHERGWPDALRAISQDAGTPLLGICLGMQLLGDRSEEGEPVEGLGLVPGETVRMLPQAGERVPHVGWNEVTPTDGARLFDGVVQAADFYFVHSYVFQPADPDFGAATTPYAGGFVSAVQRDNIYGMQFHPEKSSAAGLRVLQNFVAVRPLHAQSPRHTDSAVERLRAG
jgi:glutamine amidotransferase